ncbi:PRC-barrel domain-containing protein [Methanobrevibacter millerae]|uniref:Sporulation protein YlmC, PRC-barrel domain family n=1 Tax=Methanobrevibacter millerae TaxID=230361 RepID=A0A1G5UXH3_9EURY|nr:PRC-barrel domain-containing protein [Methanobrevibacter millerae]SDA37455.1 Sporulation protein YlmC, PRC-barrel domain family [Methanobrevibacter millerae]
MRAKELFGMTVLDSKVREVGRIEDVDIDVEEGNVESLVVSLKKGILSNDYIEVDFSNIATIGDYVLLSTEIEKEAEEAEEVTVEVEEE